MRRKTVGCGVAAGLFILLLANAQQVRQGIGEALALCVQTVIPSQFLFLTASSLLVFLGIGEVVAPRLEGFMWPLFRVDGSGAAALILGLVGGYPIGARTAVELYKTGQLTGPEAERLLAFCNTANPAFLISVLGVGIFGSVRVGVWLWLIHLLSALLTGLLFRRRDSQEGVRARRQAGGESLSFPVAFVQAVQSGLTSILNICAFVVVFYVLARPLQALPGLAAPALVGTLELFSVLPLLPAGPTGFVLASALAGWGGMSVLCQTLAALWGSGLSPKNCLRGKAAQALLSALLALALRGYVLA